MYMVRNDKTSDVISTSAAAAAKSREAAAAAAAAAAVSSSSSSSVSYSRRKAAGLATGIGDHLYHTSVRLVGVVAVYSWLWSGIRKTLYLLP